LNPHVTVPVTFTEIPLGADIPVPTLEGDEVKVRIAPGIPNGKTVRMKGCGVKKGVNAGYLIVSIEVQVPKHLSSKAVESLVRYAKTENSAVLRKDFWTAATT